MIDASMERLRPSLQYDILVERYVQGHPSVRIMTHHHLAESTLHRERMRAIRAIATDLAAQETNLARRA